MRNLLDYLTSYPYNGANCGMCYNHNLYIQMKEAALKGGPRSYISISRFPGPIDVVSPLFLEE